MVSFISTWAQQIIFVVIICVIIQMLLPEGKNKKYIKTVIGIYILFSIISPVVGKNINLDLEKYNISLEENQSQIVIDNENSINEIYIQNLKKDIETKIESQGYGFKNIEISTNENYDLNKITIIDIYEKQEDKEEKNINKIVINEIKIGEKENSVQEQLVMGIAESDKQKLKQYLNQIYNVKEENINIIGG